MPKSDSKKKGPARPGTKSKKEKVLSRNALVAETSPVSTSAEVAIVFSSGLGQLTALLFRKGLLINMQSISSSGNIPFTDIRSGDSISVNGVCSGTADIRINVPTNPTTPEHFDTGIILGGYTIL